MIGRILVHLVLVNALLLSGCVGVGAYALVGVRVSIPSPHEHHEFAQ